VSTPVRRGLSESERRPRAAEAARRVIRLDRNATWRTLVNSPIRPNTVSLNVRNNRSIRPFVQGALLLCALALAPATALAKAARQGSAHRATVVCVGAAAGEARVAVACRGPTFREWLACAETSRPHCRRLLRAPVGNVTTRAFDGLGNKLCEKEPLGGSAISYGQAAGLKLLDLERAVCTPGHLWQWSYDEDSRVLSETDPAYGLSSFVYDEVRNLLARQDANGHLTTFAFDALNRRVEEHQHLDAHPRLSEADRDSVPLAEAGTDPIAGIGTLDSSKTYDANERERRC
jgi:YD repeat-containing protein